MGFWDLNHFCIRVTADFVELKWDRDLNILKVFWIFIADWVIFFRYERKNF